VGSPWSLVIIKSARIIITAVMRGSPSQVKGAGLRLLSRRGSRFGKPERDSGRKGSNPSPRTSSALQLLHPSPLQSGRRGFSIRISWCIPSQHEHSAAKHLGNTNSLCSQVARVQRLSLRFPASNFPWNHAFCLLKMK
jgi:hypothetical protein